MYSRILILPEEFGIDQYEEFCFSDFFPLHCSIDRFIFGVTEMKSGASVHSFDEAKA